MVAYETELRSLFIIKQKIIKIVKSESLLNNRFKLLSICNKNNFKRFIAYKLNNNKAKNNTIEDNNNNINNINNKKRIT